MLTPRPDLCIIPQKLWLEAQERIQAVAKQYIRETNGDLWGRPGMGRESKYLLTGIGRCGCCGANLVVIGGRTGSAGNRRPMYYYGCSYRHNRGATVCANDTRVKMDKLDDAVLDAIQQQVLTPDALKYIVERAVQIAMERQRSEPDRAKGLQKEISRIENELDKFMALIAKGKAPDSVLTEIHKREDRIKKLEADLHQLTLDSPTELDAKRLQRALEQRVGQY
jgi:hypothetical protein